MSLMSRIFGAAPRVMPPDPLRYVVLPNQFVPQDLRLTEEEMLSASVAWSCIRLIVDSLASLEVNVLTRDDSNRRSVLIDDQVAWMWNVRANADMPAQAFKEQVWTQTLLDGDGFAYINRDMSGRPVEMWPLDSRFMRVLRDRQTQRLVYRYTHPDNLAVLDLEPWEVLHFRGPSIRGMTGDSVLYRAAKAISLSVAQERYATSYYANGANPGGLLKPPAGAQRKATEEEDNRLRAMWKKLFGNARGKAHTVAVLEPGWEYVGLETDAMKSQMIPARQFSVEDTARYFGVPLVLLGVQAAAQGYGTNVSQLYLVFARNTLLPWTNRITEESQYKLFPQRKPWREMEIDLSPLMRGDELQREQADEIAIRSGKKTLNEARAQDGLNSIGPDGDVTLIETKFQTLEHAIKAPEPAGPPATQVPGQPPEPPLPPGKKPVPDPGKTARAAVALALYAKRLESRRRDVERHAPEKVAENLEAERSRLLPGLQAECAGALGEQVEAAAAAVEAGEPAHLAVLRLAA